VSSSAAAAAAVVVVFVFVEVFKMQTENVSVVFCVFVGLITTY
jgi:hypothetical protein